MKNTKQVLIKVPLKKMRETTLQKRWWTVGLCFGAVPLLVGVAFLDRTTIASAVDLVLAGIMFAHGVHGLIAPGLYTTWEEMECNNIESKMQAAFETMMDQHAAHDFPEEPADATRKPN